MEIGKRYKELMGAIHIDKFIDKKLMIIINGNGGSGKDYLIDNLVGIQYNNTSTISPAKSVACHIDGYDSEVKDMKNRQLLHDLKSLMDDYGEVSMKYTISEFNKFIESNFDIMFIHCGEKENIRLCEKLFSRYIPVVTLFVKDATDENFGSGDPRYGKDKMYEDSYDYIFENDKDDSSILHFNNFIVRIYIDYCSL